MSPGPEAVSHVFDGQAVVCNAGEFATALVLQMLLVLNPVSPIHFPLCNFGIPSSLAHTFSKLAWTLPAVLSFTPSDVKKKRKRKAPQYTQNDHFRLTVRGII